MPHRLGPTRAKIQFLTSNEMPNLIYKACIATNTYSNTAYIQRAVCEALARDLDLDLEDLLAALPPNRGAANHLFDGTRRAVHRIGPGNTVEEVR